MTQPQRIKWVDILKGLLLLFICFSHFGKLPSVISYMTNPVAMYWVPLFFVLSGFLFSVDKHPTFSSYFKAKNKTLLIPYISLSLIIILVDWNTYLTTKGFTDNLYNVFILGIGPMKASPLWFVWVLYASSLLSYLVLKIKNNVFILLTLLILSLYSYLLSLYQIKLPFMLHVVPSASVFIVSGFYIKYIIKFRSNWKFNGWIFMILSFVVVLLGLRWGGVLGDFHLNKISLYPMFYIFPILFGLSVCFIFSKLEKYIKNNLLSNIAIYIARNGIIILATHCYLIIIYDLIANQLNVANEVINFITKLCFVALITYLLIIPLTNNYLYKAVGKKQIIWKNNYRL